MPEEEGRGEERRPERGEEENCEAKEKGESFFCLL